MQTELKAPAGKTRVIGIDLFDHEDWLVKDCDTPDEAIDTANEHNKKRVDKMDSVYYVYDDTGKYILPSVAGDHGVSP